MKEAVFLEKLKCVWGDRFAIVDGTYAGSRIKLQVYCKLHGVNFSPLPTNLLSGHGCPECGKDKLRKNRRGARAVLTTADVIARAQQVHGDQYDYSMVEYVNAKTLLKILCPQHGAFLQNYSNHVFNKRGCPECKFAEHRRRAVELGRLGGDVNGAKTRITLETCEQRARQVHGDKYQYLRMESERGKNYVVAVCKDHGEFRQAYWDHINPKAPQRCPRCSTQHSVGELEVAKYVSRLVGYEVKHTRDVFDDRTELDIYAAQHAFAIEYCGERFHSSAMDTTQNPKTRHRKKHDACASKSIRLLTLWESEWKSRPHAVKQLIRNLVGKQRATVYARKCAVEQISTEEARGFFERYHIQGGAGSGIHYALRYKRHIVAVMRFAFGQNDRGLGATTRMWTLARYATRCSVPGGASRLFKAFLREHQPAEVKSFSDNRLFAGGMYQQLGFVLDAELAPDYVVWSPRLGLRPKSHYQRRHIQQRLFDHKLEEVFDHTTDKRTEAQMLKIMKCGQLYDCGKKRWVWRAPVN